MCNLFPAQQSHTSCHQAAFQWSSTPTARTRLQFSGNSGLQVTVDNSEDPLSVFQLFLTEDILNVIVTETNCRAAQLMSQTGVRPQSRLNNWTDVCINELKSLYCHRPIPRHHSEASPWYVLDQQHASFHAMMLAQKHRYFYTGLHPPGPTQSDPSIWRTSSDGIQRFVELGCK